MNRTALLLISAAILSACARTEPANENPGKDLEVNHAAITDPGSDDPTTPGTWEASAQGESQAVVFRGQQGGELLTISCDLRGGLIVQRPGLVARGNLALMQLRNADVVRRLAVNAAAGRQPLVEARIPYNDQLIPALMSFDQPLEVRYESLDTLVLPPSPIVGDLVRTCQQTNETAGQPLEPGNAAQAQPAPAQQQAQPEPQSGASATTNQQ